MSADPVRLDHWEALRTGVVLAERPAVCVVRVSGPGAVAAVEAVVPRPLWLRDGQAVSTLWLDAEARPLADLLVLIDDQDVLLIADGLDGPALAGMVNGGFDAALGGKVRAEATDWVVLSVAGPYAWELLGDVVGPEVVGVPYLSSFSAPELGGIALRAGSTGEFGYELLVPAAAAAAARARLSAAGARFGAPWVDSALLDLAALENGFFCVRHGAVGGLDVATLQLLWRVGHNHAFPQAAGVAAARAAHARDGRRLLWVRLAGEGVPEVGALVIEASGAVGAWVHGAFSPGIGAVVGLVVLPSARAWPGVALAVAGQDAIGVAPPLLKNRSLYVDAMRHAWASRAADRLPPIVDEGG